MSETKGDGGGEAENLIFLSDKGGIAGGGKLISVAACWLTLLTI